MTEIEILEVGPRDGLQNEVKTLSVETRVEFISRLVSAGARRLEAVSFVHPERVPQMAQAEEVMDRVPEADGISYIGLVLNVRGAERAVKTRVHELNMVVPVTDTFAMRNQGRTTDQLLNEATVVAKIAREAGRRVSVTLAVAFGCPFEGPVKFGQVREAANQVLDIGVDEIAFADTIGVGGSRRVREFSEFAGEHFGDEKLRFHFHNTRNTGYSNAITAAVAGSDIGRSVTLDSSVGGFGGCPFAPAATGNIATEDLLYSLTVDGASIQERFESDELIRHAQWVAGQLGKPVQSLLPRAGWYPEPKG